VIRRCEPLFDGDDREVCGARFDDARRMAVCPHVSLDGGDTVGVPPDPEYLVAKGVLSTVDAKALQEHTEYERAHPEPLHMLDEFDTDGHLRTCRRPDPRVEGVSACGCGTRLYDLARATRLAYERQPPRMTFVPAPDNALRRYEVHRVPGPEAMAAWLNVARELQPVTTWTDNRGQLWVLTVQVVPAAIAGLPNVPRPATPDQPRSRG
jgi:hypothetical protein